MLCIRAVLLALALLPLALQIDRAAAQDVAPPGVAPLPTVQVPPRATPVPRLPPGGPAAPAAGPSAATPNAATPGAARGTPIAAAGTIQAITVEGNQRIEAGTIRSYMLVQPGDPFDPDRLDRSLKTLYATGLFQDVRLDRQGDTLVVHVVENPLVNHVAFEGNHKLTDDQLRPECSSSPRAVLHPGAGRGRPPARSSMSMPSAGYYDASGRRRRSSGCRRTASTSSSRSTTAPRR